MGFISLDSVKSFSKKERIAIAYVKSMSRTPVSFQASFVNELKEIFNEREIVIIATTIAQVNYWARLIQSLGIPPEGFSNSCPVLNLDRYTTLKT